MTADSDFEALSIDEQTERLRHLAEDALTQWDGGWSIRRLIKYRENAVFEVAAADGARAVLRIHRNGYHDDVSLRSELLWMDALAQAGVAAPDLVRPRDGAAFVKASRPDVPDERQVDLFRWIDASPVSECGDAARLTELYFEAGRLAAEVHTQALAWPLPRDFRRHRWDRAGLIGDNPLWGDYHGLPLLTPAQLDQLDRARACAHLDLQALEGEAFSLIHADFVPDNLLYNSEGLRIIDFDDCGFGWHMFELATALFFHLGEPHCDAISEALLAGYRSVRDLPAERWAQLPLFLFLRSLTYLGWVKSRPETETARELTVPLIATALDLAQAYLDSRRDPAPPAEPRPSDLRVGL